MWQVLFRGREMTHLSKISLQETKKWVFYDNVQRKRQWIDKDESPQPTPKVELHRRKVILRHGGIATVLFILSF